MRPVLPVVVEEESIDIGSSLAANQRMSRYRYAAALAEGKVVLDISSGSGSGTELLARHAARIYGCDTSAEAVEYASGNLSSHTQLVRCSECALPFCGSSFGLLTAFELFRGSFDWPVMAAEAARVLSDDGMLLTSVSPDYVPSSGFDLEGWRRLLATAFPFVVLISQRGSDGASSLGVEGPQSGSVPILALCSKREIAVALPGRLPFALPQLRDREFQVQSLRDELQEARSLSFALRQRNQELTDAHTEQSYWSNRLSAALGATQTSLRVRQHQLDLLEEQLVFKQQQLDEFRGQQEKLRLERDDLKREAWEVRQSIWLQLGNVIGLGPGGEKFPVRSLLFSVKQRTVKAVAQLRPSATGRSFAWPEPLVELISGLILRLGIWLQPLQKVGLYCLSPLLLLLSCLVIGAVDLCFAVFGKTRVVAESSPAHDSATVIIPNWNGHDLLNDFLPSVIAAMSRRGGNEIIVVDNASSDKSRILLSQKFPQVRVLQLKENIGFGGACNVGVMAASNDVVVLLNNDMRVEPDFLEKLLDKFSDPKVFAVSSQIFFADPTKRREETGLTETWWQKGRLGVTHHVDPAIKDAFPCAYPGGGSSAFDRRKFLELGGFDELYHPFYYEDTDLGRLAWKRGWKVLYEPGSVVHHNHRGTIGKKFEAEHIQQIVHRNAILYCWKNIHDWRLLLSHFSACLGNTLSFAAHSDAAWCSPAESLLAFRRLRRVIDSRWLSLSTRTISDQEAFRRPLGGYYRDRFLAEGSKPAGRLNVLFVSPYPIEPPVHGGAVFMKQAVHGLAAITNLHLISFVDNRRQLGPQERLRQICKSVKFLVRPNVLLDNQWTLSPNGVREFNAHEMRWAIHRAIYRHSIDVVQLDYTVLGQYAGNFKHIPCILFEHDISMQSLSRQIRASGWKFNLLLEYTRMRIFEPRMLKNFSRVQVCSSRNERYLRDAVPELRGRIDPDLRAGIDVSQYPYVTDGREPDTLLFIGSFRHSPNVAALTWFTKEVFPGILAAKPDTILVVVGSDPPIRSTVWNEHKNIRLLGSVPDVREALQRYSAFICPILSGSGVRVKLLEAFASGIPCISTTVGAEGLTEKSGEICEIADTVREFETAVLRLLEDDCYRSELADRARTLVQREWDSCQKVVRLEQVYRNEVNRMRDNGLPAEAAQSSLRARSAAGM